MNHSIPETEPSPLARAITALEDQLIGMTDDLIALRARIRDGQTEALQDSAKLSAELRNWLKMAMETEAKREERRKEHAGIAEDYALDLDHARAEIGCRLARLRACCGADGVS